jgi:GT2 family glycosyltransferase
VSDQANLVGDPGDWEVEDGSGSDAGVRRLKPIPDSSLRMIDAEGTKAWRSSGERPCFRLPVGLLAAGWYVLEGRLDVLDGAASRPSLYPAYAAQAAGDAEVPLPDPGKDGRLRALVLLKYDVTGLQFGPGPGPARFLMADFALRRVSRLGALAEMLRPRPGEGLSVAAGRVGRFLGEAARGGLSLATVAAFEHYRQWLVPELPDDYGTWVARHDTLTTEHLEDLRERAGRLEGSGPLISVLLPVYQTPEPFLRRCIESVLAQVWPHWQLCIADDASPDPRVMEVLCEYARADQRIQVERRAVNGHISEASNTALAMARGSHVALLDHDDELRPNALLEVAELLAADPGVGLVYSDEDKIDANGRRFDPYFKPDWDPDLLRGQNYLCHLTVLRTSLVRQVGGFRPGFEGSQDHDLVLRCSERLAPGQIRHIPRILYHWRAIPGSTALTRDAKDYAAEAGLRAVAAQLERLGSGARAEALPHGHYRVGWPLPHPAPKVSLVVPTRDRVELLRGCVESVLARTRYPAFELVVVDNGSTDPEALAHLDALSRRPGVRVLRYDRPFNYSAINNWAVGQCDGAIIGLLNNDVEVISTGWLEEMVGHATREEVGAVGAMLYYPDGTIQHAGVILGVHGVAAHVYAGRPRGFPGHGGRLRVAQRLSAVTGACLVVRREVFERAGGMDEALEVAFNDIDFCLRLRELGYTNVWTPFAELYHHESASRGSDEEGGKRERFVREIELMRQRWGGVLQEDPAYNPNLSLNSRHFDLASPPRHQRRAH